MYPRFNRWTEDQWRYIEGLMKKAAPIFADPKDEEIRLLKGALRDCIELSMELIKLLDQAVDAPEVSAIKAQMLEARADFLKAMGE